MKQPSGKLLATGAILYVLSFFFPVAVQPKGAIYLLLEAFSILNFPEVALPILGGIFIWLPTITVFLIVSDRFTSLSKWLLIPLMVLSSFTGILPALESLTTLMIFGFPAFLGAGFWMWFLSMGLIFVSQILKWRNS